MSASDAARALENQTKALEKNVERLERTLADSNQKVVDLSAENAGLVRALARNSTEDKVQANKALEDYRVNAERRIRELTAQNAELVKARDERNALRRNRDPDATTQQNLRDLQGQIAGLLGQSESFKQSKIQAEGRAAAFQRRLEIAERRVGELTQKIDTRAKDHAKTRAELGEAQSELSRLFGENDALRTRLTQVSSDRDIEVEGLNRRLTAALERNTDEN